MSKLTLALAKIGDLLVDRKIKKTQTGDPIDEVGLLIPEYQRPYK